MERPLVGIGVMVLKGDEVLMTRRKGAHGAGEYAYPGGHLEMGESIEDCARREAAEEAGIKIKDLEFLRLAHVVSYEGKQYVDIAMTAEWESGEPQLLEPDKAEGWQWYPIDNPPKPLFEFCKSAFDSLKSGKTFYDF